MQQALKQLAVVEAQLEAATGDKLDYPLRLGGGWPVFAGTE